MSKDEIFLVFSCDSRKREESKKLLLVSTKEEAVRIYLCKEILKNNFEYDNPEDPPITQAARFAEDWSRNDLQQVNKLLRYGIVETCRDGEEI